MWESVLAGLPYLVVVVVGALVCALAGPRGPGSARWRVPGVVGFGLLALQQLLQTAHTLLVLSAGASSGWYGSPTYALMAVVGGLLSLVGLVLIAVAVVRGRAPEDAAGDR